MKHPLFILSTLSLLCSHAITLLAAPGTISQTPLFIAPAIQPNIMFMLDDSGSMQGVLANRDMTATNGSFVSSDFDSTPGTSRFSWLSWCNGANLLAYNPAFTYLPWQATIPRENSPYPDMVDLKKVWVNPRVLDSDIIFGEDFDVESEDVGTVDLSAAPVVTWQDKNGNGFYDLGECPINASDPGWVRADSLATTKQQINFANWFAYYRKKEYTTKAAVSQVIASSSARMGMATIHSNNGVGLEIKDMTQPKNKAALLEQIVNIDSDGGTPLREALDNVGLYFNAATATPKALNIGDATSPILPADKGGMCQQNVVMLMTDGVYQEDDKFTPADHQDKSSDNLFVFPAHQDNEKDRLADIAMKWYKTDLSLALDNKVPVQKGDNKLNLDENNQQHLVTFGIAFGAVGDIKNDPIDRTANFDWTAGTGTINRIDDLRHAAYNGRGKFLSASRADVLINELDGAIKGIEQRQGSASAVAFNSDTLSADTRLFFAHFDSASWSGNLQSFSLNPSNGNIKPATEKNSWNAGEKLDQRSDGDMIKDRIIYTWGKDSDNKNNGVLFNDNTNKPQLSAAMQTDLTVNFNHSVDTSPYTASKQRLDFLRGDRSQEGKKNTRLRSSRLGDIINSAPVFVGTPNSNWPDGSLFGGANKYSSYQAKLEKKPREEVVYVGANDGFLHGFSADSGEEILAYAPSSPASSLDNSGLHYLTENDYRHHAYVDGELSATDVFIDTPSTTGKAWRTVLVGALGAGGRGLFALDITDPSQFSNTQSSAKNTVLWEFTGKDNKDDKDDKDDKDLGFIFGQPQVTMMNNGQWAVVVGNGYNSASGQAKLMIIYLEQGIDGSWDKGDYVEIKTQGGSPNNKNGLSQPALIDLDGNGTTDRIYAGDLFGNMWAFDVSVSGSNKWTATNLFAAGNKQPITQKPLIVKPDANWLEDNKDNQPNLMVYFGTGQFLATGDQKNTAQQTYFGIRDIAKKVKQKDLVEQTFKDINEINFRVLSSNDVDYEDDSGWFINLPESGERVIVEAFEMAGVIFFNTMTPINDDCVAGGSSWLMSVDMKTGGNPTIVTIDHDRDGSLTKIDKYHSGTKVDRGIVFKTTTIKSNHGDNYGYSPVIPNSVSGSNVGSDSNGGSGSTCLACMTKEPLPPEIKGHRQSWIQLFNF